MSKLSRKRGLLAKIEATYGTNSNPVAATDAVLCRSINLRPVEVETAERTIVRPTLGRNETLVVGKMAVAEIELEASGFGTAGPASPTPGYDALLRCCALARTIVAGNRVDYTPVSTGFDSISMVIEMDGLLHQILGARGTVTLALNYRQIPVWRFTITGLYAGVTDAVIANPALGNYQRPRGVNSDNTTAFSLHSVTATKLRELTVELGNQVVYTNYANSVEEVLIVDRQPQGRASFSATTIAVKNWFDTIKDNLQGSLSLTHGPAGNRIVPTAPAVRLPNLQYAEDNGLLFFDTGLEFLQVNGNDELVFSIR